MIVKAFTRGRTGWKQYITKRFKETEAAMRWFVLSLCLYEAAALITNQRWFPTVTTIVHDHRDNAAVVVAVGAFTAWVYYHLLLEGRVP